VQPVVRPIIKDAINVTNKARTILYEWRTITRDPPMVQGVFGHFQSSGGFFNGQQNIKRHGTFFLCMISPNTDERANEIEEILPRQTPSSQTRSAKNPI